MTPSETAPPAREGIPPDAANEAAWHAPDPTAAPEGLPYSVRAEPRAGYLRVVLAGDRSTQAASIAGWREVGRQVQLHGATRVLVVSELKGPIPTPEQQRHIMEALIGWGFEGVRTAFVLVDAVHVGELEHGELAAREHGQESRVFGSEAVAEVWLRYGEARTD